MKTVISLFIVLAILAGFCGTLYFLWNQSREAPVVYETETPFVTDIVKKTVATGAIVPRREVAIKSRVSGVVEALWVEPGQRIERGDRIARIRIIPDMIRVNEAEAKVEAARITLANAEREFERVRSLYARKLLTEAEYRSRELDYELSKQALDAARSTLELIKRGATQGGKVSNVVTATVDGMVLEVPVEVGSSIIESNTFNEGTTIATIADMGDMVFEGHIDESEVGKVKEGMPLTIRVGALEGVTFDGTLEYIAPKGSKVEGAVQFEIRASVTQRPGVFLRAGYSANADIVLDRRKGVLAIHEGLLHFENGKPFVEVEVGPGRFERRAVELGLSNGLEVEVLGGLSKSDRIKRPESAGPTPRRDRKKG